MTSELRVDNLKGSTTGGSINVLSEGTSATTNLQQGLAKSWAKVVYSGGTPSSTDSINISSYNDDGTGIYDANFTNVMSSSDYSASGMSINNTRVLTYNTFSSSFLEFKVYNVGVSATTLSDNDSSFDIHGDLA